jgi:YesN/AraC family two-component response regulator
MSEKYTILIVDDEKLILTTLQRLLRNENYNVLTAGSAFDALEILEHKKIHLIISDQRMPQMTGTELFEIVKKQYPEIIRVILSGYSDTNSIIDAINKGEIVRFIAKPWEDHSLKNTINQIIRQYEILRKNNEMSLLIDQKREENYFKNNDFDFVLEHSLKSFIFSQEIIEKLPFSVFVCDEDKKILYVNQMAEQESFLLQVPKIGKDIQNIFSTEFYQKLSSGLKSTPVKNFEHENMHVLLNHLSIELNGFLIVIQKKDS